MGNFGKRSAWRWLGRYGRDRSGNISTMVALLIVPLVGVLGIATETGNWYAIQRAAQNAADSAVLSAAQNGSINPSGTTYITEARSVSSNLGFTNGANSTTVTPVNNQPCPAPGTGNSCYKVTVSRDVPVRLLGIVGYSGTGGSGNQTVTAVSTAGLVTAVTNYCILSLATSGTGILINGGPNVNFTGCNLMSDSTSTGNSNPATTCNGQNPGAAVVSAVGTADTGCGAIAHSGAPSVADPYTGYASTNASDLADTTCSGSYPGVTWNTAPAFTPVMKVCGNLTLGTDITLPSGTVLVVQNGSIDLGSHTLSGASATLAFNTTVGAANVIPFATGTGTVNISSPTSGNWSGVAIYQNRQNGSTAVLSQTYDGNKPTWDISGLVYLPYIDLTFKGIVNKSSAGYTCFALVANTFQISGNGAIYANPMSQCIQQGLVLPNNVVSSRIVLLK
jgi:Flp pilus assembly protein TadG